MLRNTHYEAEQVEIIDLNAKPLPSKHKNSTMLVSEMAKMLGLRKTESYWLVHKNFFKTLYVANRMRVDIASFEEWYANQIRYKKVNGPPPGAKLREESYDAKDISHMLGISEAYVYDLFKDVDYILLDYWKRWPKKVFEEWYAKQVKYRTIEDRKKDRELEMNSMSMPEMAWLLGVSRGTVYQILKNKAYKDMFEVFVLAERKRITKDSFLRWYESQNRYKMVYDSIEQAQDSKPIRLPHERYIYETEDDSFTVPGEEIQPESEEKVSEESLRAVTLVEESSNPNYYSIENVMNILGVSRKTVRRKIIAKEFPAIMVAGTYRIPKVEFDEWLGKYHSNSKEEN